MVISVKLRREIKFEEKEQKKESRGWCSKLFGREKAAEGKIKDKEATVHVIKVCPELKSNEISSLLEQLNFNEGKLTPQAVKPPKLLGK